MNRPLYVQIAIVFSAIMLVTAGVSGWFVGNSQSTRLKEAMKNEVRGLAQIYSDAVARYLVVEEFAGMEDTLLHAATAHGLRDVDVTKPDGRRLLGIESVTGKPPRIIYGKGRLPPPAGNDSLLLEENDRIVVWTSIDGGKSLGWLRISKSMDSITRMQRDVWRNVLLVGIGGILTGVLLMLGAIWRPVLAIQQIRDFALSLNRNKGAQIVEDASSREIFELCVSLNQASRELADSENRLMEERERLRVTLESIGDGVIACDRAGRINLMNRVAERLTGWNNEEVSGREISEVFQLISGASFEPVDLDWRSIITTGAVRELSPGSILVTRSGDRRSVADSMSPIIDRIGEIVGFVMVFRDVTEQLAMEARQETLQEQLLHSQKMEAVGQLAGGIAHDFNNILTAIIGYSEMLKKVVKDDPKAKDWTERILQVSERATGLTRSLLAFSRKQKIELKPFDINNELLNIEKILRRIIGEDIELHMTLDSGPMLVNGDSGQIDQVLINLATNARDAMPVGGLLSIQSERVSRSFTEGGQEVPAVLLSISDTGEGMSPATRDRIFDPFFTTKEVGKGTGLGLSIVDGIIRQHHGIIHVYSEIGIGTSFRILLPLLEDGTELLPGERFEPVGGSETILLVEDEDDVRIIARDILVKAGYRVVDASNGVQALHLLAAMEKLDLILTDVIMPKMNGKELTEKILAQRQGIRVLFMSGYTWDVIQNKGVLESGAELITKPFDSFHLLQRVREILDR